MRGLIFKQLYRVWQNRKYGLGIFEIVSCAPLFIWGVYQLYQIRKCEAVEINVM